MKLITRKLRAGLLPERMIADPRVSTFGRVLFPILTLYAVPDETGEEWEFAVGECNSKWLPIGTDKIVEVLKDLSSLGYIEDLEAKNKRLAVFSFPEWVMGMMQDAGSTMQDEGLPKEKPNPPSPLLAKGGNEAKEEAVHRAVPPAGYAERGCRKDRKCDKCKAKIKRGGKYFQKSNSATAPKICGASAGVGVEAVTVTVCADEKIPFKEAREVMKAVQEEFVEKRDIDYKSIDSTAREKFLRSEKSTMAVGVAEGVKLAPHVPGEGTIWIEKLPKDQALLGMVAAEMSLEIVRGLHGFGHVTGDAFAVIDFTRGVIVNYLEVLPEF